MNFPEGDVNSRINLALNYLDLGEPDRADEHLSAAGALLADDEWFRWVYTIRFHSARAEYWLARGNPAEAGTCATASLDLARTTRRRKHIAWAHKLLGDVAAMEDRPREAVAQYAAGLSTLQRHPCPSVQWKISAALAAAHATLHQSEEAEQWRAATRAVLRGSRGVDQGRSTAGSLQAIESCARVPSRLTARSPRANAAPSPISEIVRPAVRAGAANADRENAVSTLAALEPDPAGAVLRSPPLRVVQRGGFDTFLDGPDFPRQRIAGRARMRGCANQDRQSRRRPAMLSQETHGRHDQHTRHPDR